MQREPEEEGKICELHFTVVVVRRASLSVVLYDSGRGCIERVKCVRVTKEDFPRSWLLAIHCHGCHSFLKELRELYRHIYGCPIQGHEAFSWQRRL